MGGAFSQKDSPWYMGSSSWECFGLGLLLRLFMVEGQTRERVHGNASVQSATNHHDTQYGFAHSFSTASTCSVRFIRVRIYHGHQTGMEWEGFSHLDLTADPTHPEDAEELGFG
jgi:hypothetical protein